MTWFKVDDNIVGNKKFSRMPRPDRMAATGLWTTLGSWCARELTGGFVPDHMILEVGGTRKQARLLVEADLWARVEQGAASGYTFLNWLEYQPTKEKVEADRAASKERQQRARDKAKEKSVTQSSRRDDTVSHAPVTPVSQRRHGPPDPTRPDPYLKEEMRDSASAESDAPASNAVAITSSRAAALPEKWKPDPDVIDAMHTECPDIDLQAEHRKFADYWRGTGKPMKDWNAVWRNWIRRSAETASKPGGTRARTTDIDWDAAADRAAARDRNAS